MTMKLRTLIFSCLTAILVLSEQTQADIITFEFDSIPNGETSWMITESGLTLLMLNAVSTGGIIAAADGDGGAAAARGLTFDFMGSQNPDMSAIDISFDDEVMIVGYDVSVSDTDFANGTYTVSFGSVTDQSTAVGSYGFQPSIDLASGEALTIADTSGTDFGRGYFIISSLTVQTIPEPSAFILLAMGGLALVSRR
jgi:hypothetical protein